jgi:hypothetical protein
MLCNNGAGLKPYGRDSSKFDNAELGSPALPIRQRRGKLMGLSPKLAAGRGFDVGVQKLVG